jgi:hydroxymethylpyrimidine kinase/phosphomethylpyrimidine kinase/thiamine-phosphate diphosphorylase
MVHGKVLVVAGSDSGGGAGIQADIKACLALGAFATTAVTALTAQNTLGVHGVHATPLDFVDAQITAVVQDLHPDAVKTGMLANAATVCRVADAIALHKLTNVVVDTVMFAKGGCSLLENEAVEALRNRLIPLATVITPNVPEAATLLGVDDKAFQKSTLEARCRELGGLGPRWVLLKGGHVTDDTEESTDHLYDVVGGTMYTYSAVRERTRNTHGTGCTLASAIAASLAQGLDVPSAVARAKKYVTAAIRSNPGYGAGHGPLDHMPFYAASAATLRGAPFTAETLRLYLVSCEALSEAKLVQALKAGVTIVQMRDKETEASGTAALIAKAKAMKSICDEYNVPFIVNDRVDVAVAVDASGVHLGQSDMSCADARRILGPSKIVGVSAATCELALAAHAAGADYVGSGACFGTSSKGDAVVIGLAAVAAVVKACRGVGLPVVAIGGISCATGREVLARTGADGIAVISAVAGAGDVRTAVAALLPP